MTDETKPSKVHKVATYAASALVAGAKAVSGLAGKLPIVSQVKTAIVSSARTWEIAAFWLLCVIAAYAWGHQEEAKKYTQVFARLSACVSNQQAVKVPVCPSNQGVKTDIAPAPVVAPPPALPEANPVPVPHKKKRAAAGSWWQF